MPTYLARLLGSPLPATPPDAEERSAARLRPLVRSLFAAALCACVVYPVAAQQTLATASVVQQANAHLTETAESGATATPQTRAALTARRTALEQVFETAPATARSYALDAKTRDALLKADPTYATLIEQDVPLTGELAVTVQDNLKARTSQTVYSLHTYTGDLDISFVKQPVNLKGLAHHQVTLTGLSFPHLIAAETIRGATLAEAEACSVAAPAARMSVLSSAHAQTVPPFTGPGVTTTAPTACSDLGPQNTAVIILNMPSTPPRQALPRPQPRSPSRRPITPRPTTTT